MTTEHTLAEIPGSARAYLCGHCGDVHLAIGPVCLRVERNALTHLADMLQRAAAEVSGTESFEPTIERGPGSWLLRKMHVC